MKQRLLIATLVLVVVGLLTGCGPDEEFFTSSSADSDRTSVSASATNAPETSKNPASRYAITPQFDDASAFNDAGYAVVGVQLNGKMKYGVIDETGEYVIEARFDAYDMPSVDLTRQENIDNTIIWLREGDRWSIVNDAGEWLSESLFENYTYFSENGLAGVEIDDRWGFCNRKGQVVIVPQFSQVRSFDNNGYALVCVDEKWGTVNEAGDIVIEPQYFRITTDGALTDLFLYWSDGGARVYMIDDGNYNYGLISEIGEILAEPILWIPPIFASNGLAPVKTEQGYVYLNTAGRIVIEAYNALEISRFSNRFASIQKQDSNGNEFYVFINEEGETVGLNHYEYIGVFSENGMAPASIDGKFGYIDSRGEFVIRPQFAKVASFDVHGYAVVGDGTRYAILNDSGELMTQYIFDEYRRVISNHMSLAFSVYAVAQNGKWGFVHGTGEVLIAPLYDDILFSDPDSYEGDYFLNLSEEPLFLVISGEKKGIVNLQGELLLEPIAEQDCITVSSNGMTAVRVNGEYGYVDLDE